MNSVQPVQPVQPVQHIEEERAVSNLQEDQAVEVKPMVVNYIVQIVVHQGVRIIKDQDVNMRGVNNTGIQEGKISGDDKVEITGLSLRIKITEDNTINLMRSVVVYVAIIKAIYLVSMDSVVLSRYQDMFL